MGVRQSCPLRPHLFLIAMSGMWFDIQADLCMLGNTKVSRVWNWGSCCAQTPQMRS